MRHETCFVREVKTIYVLITIRPFKKDSRLEIDEGVSSHGRRSPVVPSGVVGRDLPPRPPSGPRRTPESPRRVIGRRTAVGRVGSGSGSGPRAPAVSTGVRRRRHRTRGCSYAGRAGRRVIHRRGPCRRPACGARRAACGRVPPRRVRPQRGPCARPDRVGRGRVPPGRLRRNVEGRDQEGQRKCDRRRKASFSPVKQDATLTPSSVPASVPSDHLPWPRLPTRRQRYEQ